MQRSVCFSVLEAGKAKVGAPARSGSGEASLPGLQGATFLLCPHAAFPLCAHGRGRQTSPSLKILTYFRKELVITPSDHKVAVSGAVSASSGRQKQEWRNGTGLKRSQCVRTGLRSPNVRSSCSHSRTCRECRICLIARWYAVNRLSHVQGGREGARPPERWGGPESRWVLGLPAGTAWEQTPRPRGGSGQHGAPLCRRLFSFHREPGGLKGGRPVVEDNRGLD